MISQYLGAHGFSASGDITYLICYITSYDHLIESSCKFMVGPPHGMSPPS